MARDARVYCILNIDTNGEVEYSTTHLFDEEGHIARSRVCHGDQHRNPHEELAEMLRWGDEHLALYYEGAFNEYVG